MADTKPAGQAPDAVLEALTAGVLDLAPVGIAAFDTEGRILGFNAAYAAGIATYFPGASTKKMAVGVPMSEVVPETESFERVASEFQAALADAKGGAVRRDGVRIEHGGMVSYFDAVMAPFIKDGEVAGLLQVLVNVTEREEACRRLEEKVEERTAELERRRMVAEGLHEVLSILNSCCPTEEVLDYIVGQAKKLLEGDANGVYRLAQGPDGIVTITSHGIVGDLMLDMAYPADGFVAKTVMRGKPLVAGDTSGLFGPNTDEMQPEHRDRLRTIFTRYRGMLAVPIIIAERVWGALVMYYEEPREFSDEDVGLAMDLGDHLALALENAQLRQSAEQAAALDERARLARDLHDAVTQTLFSASLIAEVLPRLWDRDRDEGLKRLEQLQHLTRGALAEMRTLLLELRPAALEEADLGEVLRQLAESKTTTGLDVEVVLEGEPRKLPSDMHLALYRTAQEALNNIVKHSGAGRAELALRYLRTGVELDVDDNGSGFDPGRIGGEHMGLRIMRERAEAVGGAFKVESTPGIGTCVSVVVGDREDGSACRTA